MKENLLRCFQCTLRLLVGVVKGVHHIQGRKKGYLKDKKECFGMELRSKVEVIMRNLKSSFLGLN